MSKSKKITIGMLTSTLIFSNIQFDLAYANELNNRIENINNKTVKKYENNTRQVINIPDANLKKAIYEYLGKDSNSNITISELQSIERLVIFGEEISNLEGIQYCTNLTHIYLRNNNIKDISLLSKLSNLEYLDLDGNKVSDISALSKLNNLKYLDLRDNKISDISALSKLNNLDVLVLMNNEISDISPLSELSNLEYLDLDGNEISDISALSELNLYHLNLNNNKVSNISALSKQINLNDLYLDNNNVSDISIISNLSNLLELHLDNNKIIDISSLSNLSNLVQLSLNDNEISDITPISKLHILDDLFLANNKISDITPLMNIKPDENYCRLDLSYNLLDLNNYNTRKVIEYLESIGFEIYYGNQSTETPPLTNPTTFNDIEGHWANITISDFIQKGYIKGYEDNTFRPNNNITRAEFITVLNKVFGLTDKNGIVFSDTNNHWAKDAIDIAVTNGVCNGVSNVEFRPDDYITREQVSVMVANYKKIKDIDHDKLNTYTDSNNVSSWAKDSVEGMIENGYMNGYSEDNTFRPINNITRAEAISTLSRVIK